MADDDEPRTSGGFAPRPAPDRIARAVAKARIAGKLFEKHEPVKLGRYHLLEQVGSGGMGVVWGAWDPELERRVAIKLVKATGERAKERIQAEGQALAKLSHPNVVPVYDVGVVDDQVYLVMEWVRGKTLRAWAKDAAVREIIAAMRAAGEGLAAAHAAGLVHRDFKPDNAIVGDDGRVRVLDFGLATSGESGDVAGTPKYMAPEQRVAGELTPAIDQFAFGVTLRELVPEPPPRWIAAIVTRATAEASTDRFPSMANVLHALGRDPRTVWTRRFALAGVMGIAGGAFAAGSLRGDATTLVEPCTGAAAEISTAWNAPQPALEDHVRSLGPYGAAIAGEMGRDLATWTESWATSKRAACLASHAGELPAPTYERVVGCFARARASFAATTSALGATTTERLANSVLAVRSLPEVERCRAESELSNVAPPPAALAERVAALAGEVERARVLALAADPLAIALGSVVELNAMAVGYEPLLARAALAHGNALLSEGLREPAIVVLDRAVAAALASGDATLAIEAIARQLYAVATMADRTASVARDAAAATRLAEPIARSLAGNHGAFARSLLYNNIGTLHLAEQAPDIAASYFRRGLDGRPPLSGPRFELAALAGNLGMVESSPARRDELLAREATELAMVVGADHPRALDAVLKSAIFLDDDAAARTRMTAACARYHAMHPHLVEKVAQCAYEVGWLAYDAGDGEAAASAFRWITISNNEGRLANGYLLLASDPGGTATRMRALATELATQEHAWLRLRSVDALIIVAYAERAVGHSELVRTTAKEALARLDQLPGFSTTTFFRRRQLRLRALAQ